MQSISAPIWMTVLIPDYNAVARPQPETGAGDQQRRDANKRETQLASTWKYRLWLIKTDVWQNYTQNIFSNVDLKSKYKKM